MVFSTDHVTLDVVDFFFRLICLIVTTQLLIQLLNKFIVNLFLCFFSQLNSMVVWVHFFWLQCKLGCNIKITIQQASDGDENVVSILCVEKIVKIFNFFLGFFIIA